MTTLVNHVRRGFYMDSVALMRISRSINAMPGVQTAALMIGSGTNKRLLLDAGLLNEDGEKAGVNDLIVAVRAADQRHADAGLDEAAKILDVPVIAAGEWIPKTLNTALEQLPCCNLALISVAGEFAAAEARNALNKGLHVMMFSDNVPIADEVALKREAQRRGLLMMGPDCGTAIIGGVPLAFANAVPRGAIGIVSASGTGLQEVSSLIARNGMGISHAIGVGGRDLKEEVGGITTLMAIDALDRDPDTQEIVLISKPPAAAVAQRVLDRAVQSTKKFSICFIGADAVQLSKRVTVVSELRSAAEAALAGRSIAWRGPAPSAADLAGRIGSDRRKLLGLFCGGTLCAEAQVFFGRAGVPVVSNVPIPGMEKAHGPGYYGNIVLDLGEDEYTIGRPHPMIDPTLRNQMLVDGLKDDRTAVILLDVILGYGAHADPAGELVAQLATVTDRAAVLIASVCGTDEDPQSYSQQVQILQSAGIIVAPSNAHAAELAIETLRALP